MRAPTPMTNQAETFAERYSTWETLHRLYGPGRSYPYAWRLPELARSQGQGVLARAQHALALDLYTLGRFPESQAVLEGITTAAPGPLGHRLSLLLGRPVQEEATTQEHLPGLEATYLAYLGDRPLDAFPSPAFDANEPDHAWATLLQCWHRARSGAATELAPSHGALSALRALHPTLAAQGEALLAETCYTLDPRWASVWLDHALDQVDLYSQHHLKARLMGLKARALEAGGELGEGARFRKQARALAERQGARLYLGLFIEEEAPVSPLDAG